MKKSLRIVMIFLAFISLFFVTKVSAATSDISITDVSIDDKGGTIDVETPVLDGNKLTSKIKFNAVGDYVDFKFTFKNTGEEKYKIISIEDNNTVENVSIDYNYSKSYIEKGKTSEVLVKIKYKDQVTGTDKLSLNDLTIKFNFEREDGQQSEIVVNPTTGDALVHYLVLLIIAITGIGLILFKKRKKLGTLFIILATVLIPFAALANEQYNIEFKFSDIEVVGEIPLTYSTLRSGEEINEMLPEGTTFREATADEYEEAKANLTEANIISTDDSEAITYMWKSGDTVLYYSEADVVKLGESAAHMFENTGFTSIDLSGLDSSDTTDMSYMFSEASNLTDVDVSSFDTEKVVTMADMFYECTSLTELDLSSFGTTALEDIDYMFGGDENLTTIYVSNKWDPKIVVIPPATEVDEETETSQIAGEDTFYGCNSLVGDNGTAYDNYYNRSSVCARPDMGPLGEGYFTLKDNTEYVILIEGSEINGKLSSLTTTGKSFRKATVSEYNSVKDNLTDENIISISKTTPCYMWETNTHVLYYANVTNIYLNPDASYMFQNVDLVNIDVSDLNGIGTTDMSYMFYGDDDLENINFGEYIPSNTVGFATNDKLSASILSIMSTSNLSILLIPIIFIILGAVACLVVKKLKIKNMSIAGIALILLVVSITAVSASYGINKIIQAANQKNAQNTSGVFNTSRVTNMDSMFEGCSKLTELDLSVFDNSELGTIERMFANCTSLETVYVSDRWTVTISSGSGFSSQMSGEYAFDNCINIVGGLGTRFNDNRDNYGDQSVYAHVDGEDGFLGYFTMKGKEKTIPDYAVLKEGSDFNTDLYNLDGLKFRKATAEEYEAKKDELTEDNSIADPDSYYDVYMWKEGTDVVYYSEADTIYMNVDCKDMFSSTSLISIDLSGLRPDHIIDLSGIFSSNYSLGEINLSSFPANLSFNYGDLIMSAGYVETIYVSDLWDPNDLPEDIDLFSGLDNLVGGAGTAFDNEHTGRDYAHIDGGPSNPGYLTSVDNPKDFTILLNGYNFNEQMSYVTENERYFRKATVEEYNAAKSSLGYSNIMSESKTNPVYVWQVEDDVLYYSEASTIYLNEDSSNLFSNTYFVTIDLSGFDSSHVTDMGSMFSDCSDLETVNLQGFDTTRVTNMDSMFSYCGSLEDIDLTSFDTSNVESMSSMFEYCSSLVELDLSSFDTHSLTTASSMFNCAYDLTTIYVSDSWDLGIEYTESQTTINVYSDSMFSNCESLIGEQGTTYEDNKTDGEYGRIDGALPGYLSSKTEKDFTMLIKGEAFNARLLELGTTNKNFRKATAEEYNAKKSSLTDDDNVAFGQNAKVYLWVDSNNILYYSEKPTIYLNTDASHMFENTEFINIDLSGMNSGRTKDMNHMFYQCSSLTTIDFGDSVSVDDTVGLLNSNKLSADLLSVGGNGSIILILLLPLIIVGIGLYILVKKLKANNRKLTVGGVAVIVLVLSLTLLLGSYGINKAFAESPTNNTTTVNFDTSRVTTMESMFEGCSSLIELDISSFTVPVLENTDAMFKGCSSLVRIYASYAWDDVGADIGSFDGLSAYEMFDDCTSLVGGQGTAYNQENSYSEYARVDDGYMHPGYFTLKGSDIISGYSVLVSGGNFHDKYSSLYVDDPEGSSTGTPQYPPKYFRMATAEEYNDQKAFLDEDNIASDSSYSQYPTYMWFSPEADAILFYSEAPVIYMNEYSNSMFYGSPFVSIDLTGMNSISVTDMDYMFESSSKLEIVDISALDTRNVSYFASMFQYCPKLKTIYASDKWTMSEYYSSMFYDDEELVGGAGTTYDSSNYSSDYAHIDGGVSNPGYFTNVADKPQN